MPTFEFTERELQTAVNALRVAAERFNDHAKTMRDAFVPHLAQQFERQASESRELAAKLEEA